MSCGVKASRLAGRKINLQAVAAFALNGQVNYASTAQDRCPPLVSKFEACTDTPHIEVEIIFIKISNVFDIQCPTVTDADIGSNAIGRT